MNNCGRRSLIRNSIRSILINGLCNFEDGTRAATAASKKAPSKTVCTSEQVRGVLCTCERVA